MQKFELLISNKEMGLRVYRVCRQVSRISVFMEFIIRWNPYYIPGMCRQVSRISVFMEFIIRWNPYYIPGM